MMKNTLIHKIIDLRLKQSRNNGQEMEGEGVQVASGKCTLVTVHIDRS